MFLTSRRSSRGPSGSVRTKRSVKRLTPSWKLRAWPRCGRAQAPAVQSAGSQTDHFLFPVNNFEGQVGPDADHDHVDRIGPDIDGGDAHGGGETLAGLAGGLLVTSTLYTARSVYPSR